MNRAEKDKLERLGDKDLFFKFLPYAIALNVADSWAKAFEGIYQEPPNWYLSPGGFHTFSPYTFTHSFNSFTSNLSTAVFSARGEAASAAVEEAEASPGAVVLPAAAWRRRRRELVTSTS